MTDLTLNSAAECWELPVLHKYSFLLSPMS